MAMVVTAQTGLSNEVAASAAVYPKYARANVQCAEYMLMSTDKAQWIHRGIKEPIGSTGEQHRAIQQLIQSAYFIFQNSHFGIQQLLDSYFIFQNSHFGIRISDFIVASMYETCRLHTTSFLCTYNSRPHVYYDSELEAIAKVTHKSGSMVC